VITPREYIDGIKSHLIDHQWVAAYEFLFERATDDSAFVRARIYLTDESIVHFSEYSEFDEEGELSVKTYAYHWMTASKNLRRRWDNTPHYPHLPEFPNHVHDGDEKNVLPSAPMNLLKVLDIIADELKKTTGGRPQTAS